MKRSTVNVKTALRFRQGFIIVFLILCGIILSIAASAKPTISGKHISSVRKQNKRYANACQLLEDKRNKKEKVKVHKGKYR